MSLVLGTAKVVNHDRSNCSDWRLGRHQILFQELLPRKDFFQLFASASACLLPRSDDRCLSNLAYAYAIVDRTNRTPVFNGGSTLFDHVVSCAIGCLEVFNPQVISNMMWAYVTAGESSPRLFKKVTNCVVARGLKTFIADVFQYCVGICYIWRV